MADAAANPPSSSSPAATPAAAPATAPAAPPPDPLIAAVVALGAEALPLTQDAIPAFRVERDAWPSVARSLRDDPPLSFEMLVDVAGIDFPKRRPRFEVVYHLWSLRHNRVVRVKVGVPEEDPTCPSVVDLWGTADWHERECFDLVGVKFAGHPDLRRILMWETYAEGFPLRKAFPLRGRFSRAEQVRQALNANPEAHYSLDELSIADAWGDLPDDMRDRLKRGERGTVPE